MNLYIERIEERHLYLENTLNDTVGAYRIENLL
jgi:hypothetical protein